jgi:hypothetical protein
MISDYLQNDFDSNKCDELSAEIMDLLYALLSFGFYCSFEHIYDITVPLIQVPYSPTPLPPYPSSSHADGWMSRDWKIELTRRGKVTKAHNEDDLHFFHGVEDFLSNLFPDHQTPLR